MTSSLVSIVIPCYRQGNFLSDAIQSALAQTYPRIEVVVVNDGSDDDTDQVAARYRQRIRYVFKTNGGLCSARNAGIAAAQGRYLLFLDADDLLHPDAVIRMVACMQDRDDRLALTGFRHFVQDPSAEVSEELLPAAGAAWFAKTFETDPLLSVRPSDLNAERLTLLPYLIYTNFGPPHCWLSSRKMVLEVGGFDESLSGCGDWDLWFRLALARAQLVTSRHVGAFYRRYEGSMSRDDVRMLNDRVKLLLKTSQAIRHKPEALQEWAPHLNQAARRTRRRCVAFGLRSACIGDLTREIRVLQRLNPSLYRRLVGAIIEPTVGALRDQLALTFYRHVRPDLFSYYRSDID